MARFSTIEILHSRVPNTILHRIYCFTVNHTWILRGRKDPKHVGDTFNKYHHNGDEKFDDERRPEDRFKIDGVSRNDYLCACIDNYRCVYLHIQH